MWYNIYVQHVREFLALFYLRVISSGLKFTYLVVFQSISYVCSCLMANVQYIWNECSFAFYSCWDHCVITRNLLGITLSSMPEQLIIVIIMLIMAVHGGDINQEHIIDYIISIFCFDFVHFFVASLSDWWYCLTSENDELRK